MLWDRISPPRPPARSAREAGCPGKPAPETSRLPDPARAFALRLPLRVNKGGGHRPDPAPHHPPPTPGPPRFPRPGRSWGWGRRCVDRSERATGASLALGKGQREGWGCWRRVGVSVSPPPLPALGSGPAGGVRRPGYATLPAPLLCLHSNPRSWGRGGRGGGQRWGLGVDSLFWGEEVPGLCVFVPGLGGLERRKLTQLSCPGRAGGRSPSGKARQTLRRAPSWFRRISLRSPTGLPHAGSEGASGGGP